jgi:hypothetical protein
VKATDVVPDVVTSAIRSPWLLSRAVRSGAAAGAADVVTSALRSPWLVSRAARSGAAAGAGLVALSAASAVTSAIRRRTDSS